MTSFGADAPVGKLVSAKVSSSERRSAAISAKRGLTLTGTGLPTASSSAKSSLLEWT